MNFLSFLLCWFRSSNQLVFEFSLVELTIGKKRKSNFLSVCVLGLSLSVMKVLVPVGTAIDNAFYFFRQKILMHSK